jgi:hypothetical protein
VLASEKLVALLNEKSDVSANEKLGVLLNEKLDVVANEKNRCAIK